MSHRYRNARGEMVVRQGRVHRVPFPIADWPQRKQGLDSMQAAESAANEQRAAYRAWERVQPCGGCGHAAPGHATGCIWRTM